MKYLKFLLIIGIFCLNAISLKSQSFFKDSSRYFSYIWAPTVSPGIAGGLSLDSIHLDSISNGNEYYSIFKLSGNKFAITDTFWLRVTNKQVFCSGKFSVNWFANHDTSLVKDALIFDFNKKSGDTIVVKLDPLNTKTHDWLVIDSIKNIPYSDGTFHKTFYFRGLKGVFENYRFAGNIAIENIGFKSGLLYFATSKSIWSPTLIIACKKSSEFYYYDEWFDGYHQFNLHYCDNESRLIDSFWYFFKREGTFKWQKGAIKVFPNPSTGNFTINLPNLHEENCEVEVVNSIGQKIFQSNFIEAGQGFQVNLGNVNKGLHFLILHSGKSTFTQKILIE